MRRGFMKRVDNVERMGFDNKRNSPKNDKGEEMEILRDSVGKYVNYSED